MTYILTHFEIVAGVLLTGSAIIWVLQQRRSPQSALAWILFIIMLPYLGVPLFFALGMRKRGARYARISFDLAAVAPPVDPLDDQLRRLDIPPASTDNTLALETTPEMAGAALETLVAGARDRLDVALYRLDTDTFGEAFVAHLTAAARRGVQVRLLLDQFGTFRRPRKALKALREAGGEVRLFSPFVRFPATGRLNLRNHRKMLIRDGCCVWAGGRNVGESYLGPADDPATWHDLSYTIAGPAVRRYVEVFEADWEKQSGVAASVRCSAEPVAGGTATLQLIPSGPDMRHDGLHDMLVHAIHNAQAKIWIATPYFLPTDQLLHALATAARLGRDVRILVPAKSNQRIADFARGGYLRNLEEEGCTILRFTGGMVHAKAIVIDDVAFLGSANFDIRSMLLNFETSLAVYDAEHVTEVAAWFTALEAGCVTGTRPTRLPRRLAEATFRLGAPVL